MKKITHSLAVLTLTLGMQQLHAQCDQNKLACFTSIAPTAQTDSLIIADTHRFQMLFKQGEPYLDGSGLVPGNHDFTGYVPINGSSEHGYLSVNHENTPGGVSILDLHFNTNTQLWEVENSRPVDLYNEALVTTTRNCSGTVTPWGTIITAEESTNAGDLNNDGYQDVGWLVEIDPVTASVKDYGSGQEKLWALGRMSHENVVVTADGTTAYFGEDGGTHCVYKFVADTPFDLTSGNLYVLQLSDPLNATHDPVSSAGTWIQVPNDTKAERNTVNTAAAALGGTSFNGVEDCEIDPLTGMIYFTAKGYDRVYRFQDNGAAFTDFETFVGGQAYSLQTAQGAISEPWGDGNDNLTFDGDGNLWVLQDGGNNYIWVVSSEHTQANPKVKLFASMPAGSEPTGLTFSPDYRFGFFSVQSPDDSNVPQTDAAGNQVAFDASATVVFSLKDNIGLGMTSVSAEDIKVYPNPTDGIINIQLPEYKGQAVSVKVYNIIGQELFSTQIEESLSNNTLQINVKDQVQSEQILFVNITVGQDSSTFKVAVN